MDPTLVVAFLVLGAIVGFLAGLLGIGGGMTMVPLLTFVFTREGFAPEHVVHMAIATATATILFTSIASMREHQRHRAILWPVVAALAPGHHRRARSSGRRSSARCRRRCCRGSSASSSPRRRPTSGSIASRSRRTGCPGRGGLIAVGAGIGAHREHGRRGRRVHDGAVHDRLQRSDAQLRRDFGGDRSAGRGAATIGFVIAGIGADRDAAAHDRLRPRAGAARDRRGERDLRAVRRARGAPVAGQDAEAGVRVRAVRARRLHACGSAEATSRSPRRARA